MQRVEAATLQPNGAPFEFLPADFCPGEACDYGHLAASHDGGRLVFECRKAVAGEAILDQEWNLCIAEIDASGHAVNARFLLTPGHRHRGLTFARATPFGLYQTNRQPYNGRYDEHFQMRRVGDYTPVFSPDDRYVVFASLGPDPRTGIHATQTCHGVAHLGNIVAAPVSETGSTASLTTIYANEGGVADFPLFFANGNVAFHTWNRERTDRDMYQQSRADGSGDLPVRFGRLQGPSMWGKAVQLANGALFGITGRRRADMEQYVAFLSEHTLGLGFEAGSGLPSMVVFGPAVHAQVTEFGYCGAPKTQ